MGESVRDTARLFGATFNAGGKVYYRYYNSRGSCLADTATWTGSQYLHGNSAGTVYVMNGMVPPSQFMTFGAAGTFFWAAFYTGDYNNQAAASNCWDEVLWVKPCKPRKLQNQHVTVATAATGARPRNG